MRYLRKRMKHRLDSSGIVGVSLRFVVSSIDYGETVGMPSMVRYMYLVAQETFLAKRPGCALPVCIGSSPGRKGVVDGQEIGIVCSHRGEKSAGGKIEIYLIERTLWLMLPPLRVQRE